VDHQCNRSSWSGYVRFPTDTAIHRRGRECGSAQKRDPTSDRPQLVDRLKEIFLSVGVPIGADRDAKSGVFSSDFSYLLQFWPGSRFGAGSHLSWRFTESGDAVSFDEPDGEGFRWRLRTLRDFLSSYARQAIPEMLAPDGS
jgi:hypothetical protein